VKKPTILEIAAYCTSRNNNVDAETFWHHYEANGWKTGKNAIPMSVWKSAVITWEKRNPKPIKIKPTYSTPEDRKRDADNLRSGKTLSFQEVGRRLIAELKKKRKK